MMMKPYLFCCEQTAKAQRLYIQTRLVFTLLTRVASTRRGPLRVFLNAPERDKPTVATLHNPTHRRGKGCTM